MKWGFDLDGTLDHPEIAALANVLFDAGEEVHIVTANRRADEKLDRLGVRRTKVHVTWEETMEKIGLYKAKIIRSEGINLMIDDSPIFIEQMAAYCSARLLKVV